MEQDIPADMRSRAHHRPAVPLHAVHQQAHDVPVRRRVVCGQRHRSPVHDRRAARVERVDEGQDRMLWLRHEGGGGDGGGRGGGREVEEAEEISGWI